MWENEGCVDGQVVMKSEDLEAICNYFGVSATTFIKTEAVSDPADLMVV